VVTIVVSLMTQPKEEAELVGLVYGVTPHQADEADWWRRPAIIATLSGVLCLALNLIFF
jgi:SSS family solute:Na+ symporter